MEIQGPIKPTTTFSFTVTPEEAQRRFDSYLASKFTGYSRSFFQRVIKDGLTRLNDTVLTKAAHQIQEDDVVAVTFPQPPERPAAKILAQDIGVELVAEHEHFLIINKPAGLLVHPPSQYCKEPTLIDWLLHHFAELAQVGNGDRPGIVHRLDKDTSGLMVIPRNNYAHTLFGDLFKNREIKKTYLAVVTGQPEPTGSITYGITRHPTIKTRMMYTLRTTATLHRTGKIRAAQTDFRVRTYFNDCALVEAQPVTGRTHQIRVHFAALRHPLVGDTVYGTSSKHIKRHALHATSLAFTFEGKHYSYTVEPPEDFNKLTKRLAFFLKMNKS